MTTTPVARRAANRSSLPNKSIRKAGELWRRFCLERPRHAAVARRIVADFLIGAHALLQAERLLTRDQGFYRNVFAGLQLTAL